MSESYRGGQRAAAAATGGASTMGTIGGANPGAAAPAPSSPPAWAQRMRRHQTMTHGATTAAHAVRTGDSHGGGASISLRQDERS
jgi:type IV secretion system protein TrbL